MTNLAIDVSNVNPIAFGAARASGCKLLIAKATEGANFDDKTVAAHRKIAGQLGIRFGSYLFLHAFTHGSEAAEYLAWAKPRKGELVFIDSEPGGQDHGTVTDLAARTDRCARALEVKGFDPILYASSSVWKQMVAAVPALKRLRVWEADYPGRFTRMVPGLLRLRAKLCGAHVVLWQFTDRYQINGHGYDASLILVPADRL